MTVGPLTCAEAFRRLDDYLDRELSVEEQQAVTSHLELCARCAEEFAVERALLDDVRTKLSALRMPEGLMARISSRLRSM